MHGRNSPDTSVHEDLTVSHQEFVTVTVHAVDNVGVYDSLTRLSTTGGYQRERQVNRMVRLH